MNGASSPSADTSHGAARRMLARAFAEAGLDTPDLDARLFVCAASGLDHAGLVREAEAPLGEAPASRLRGFAARRLAREPVARILGRREFWGLDLVVAPDVLDPRADSETLIETALRLVATPPARILDLGAGSGALLCALLGEWRQAIGVAIDLSPAACAATRTNLARCGLGSRALVVRGDWDAALAAPFDLVVSNPPYIAADDIDGLAPEVRAHDPRLALDGGPDGLDAYRALAPVLARRLNPGGLALLEFGVGQGEAVADLLRAAGLDVDGFADDLSGRPRVVVARRGGEIVA